MSESEQSGVAVIVIALGMTGLFLNIEYSGWVLFVGLAVVLL
jgi:hypothetical protein